MASKIIAWNAGNGNITVDYGGSGDGTITVTSDSNSLYEVRSQQITVRTTDGSNIEKTITIQQAARVRVDISTAVVTAANQTYSGSAKTPTPTVTLNGDTVPSTGYDVTYSNNTNAGTANITVTGKGDYTGTASGTFTIAKATPTVVAPTPNVLEYTGSAQALCSAGNTDFGTLKYRIGTSGTWSTSVPTATNHTTNGYDVYYMVEGSSNVNDMPAAGPVTCNISEKPVTATVTLSQTEYTYNGSACTPSVTVKDGSTIIPASEYTVTYSNNTNAGTATVTISDNAGGNYEVIGSATFTIAKASISPYVIMSGWTYGGTASDPSVSGNPGGGGVTYSYKGSSAPDTSYTTTKPSNAGDYVVRAIVAETSNYLGATVTNTFTVAQREVTLTWGTTSWTYDKSAHSTTCTAGNLVTGDTCTVTLTGNSITDKGTATVTASSLSNSNYKLPSANTATLTVNARVVTLTWGTLSWTYDGSAHGTTCTAGNLCSGDTCTVTLTDNSITNKGTATVTASSLSNSNYTLPSSKTATLTITARPINITASSASKTYDGSALTSNSATAEAAGTNRGLVSGHSMTSCTVTGTITNAGSASNVPSAAVIKTSGGTDVTSNYDITYVNGTLSVSKAAGSISYANTSVSKTYGNAAFTNALTKSGDGSVTYASSDTSVATVNSSGQVTIVKAGSCTITATVADGANYTYATKTASYSLSIAKANPVYNAPTANNRTYNTSSAALLVAGSNTTPGSFTYSTSQSGTYSTTIPSQTNAGTYTTWWKFTPTDTTNYNSVGATSVSTTISPKTVTATVTLSQSTYTYSGSACQPTATVKDGSTTIASSEYTVSYSNNTNAGTATVTITDKSGGNYTVSGSTTFTINKADPTYTAPAALVPTYSGSAQNLISAGSTSHGTITYSTSSSGTYSSTIPQGTDAGTYTVYWKLTGDSNHNDVSATQVTGVSIAKANAPITTEPVAKTGLVYNGTAQQLCTNGVASIAGTWNYPTSINAATTVMGTVYFTPTDSTNYNQYSKGISTSIAKADPTYTAPTENSLTYNGNSRYLTTTGSTSHGTIQYSENGSSWSATRISKTTAGTYTTYWRLVGDANHNDVESTSITTTINKASRTISFGNTYYIQNTSTTTTRTATPSAGSGDGAITYSISSTTYATINSSSGAVTSKTSDGSATVTATIAEGTNYLSANASYTLYVFATTHNFSYTGSVQSVTLPPGSYTLQTWGAQGGSNAADSAYNITSQRGGYGGYSTGVLTVSSPQTVYVFVGGQGSSSGNGGWNGGGGSTGSSSYQSGDHFGTTRMSCGGGATDIATVTSSMSYSSYRNNRSSASLLSRMIVAGGGSGGEMCQMEYSAQTTTWETVLEMEATASIWAGAYNAYYVDDALYGSINYGLWLSSGSHTGERYRMTAYAASGTLTSFWLDALNNKWGNQVQGEDITISDQNRLFVRVLAPDKTSVLHFKVEKATTTTLYDRSYGEQIGYAGGGVTGDGFEPAWKGKQNAAGTNGEFGKGANQTATNYRYCSSAGGGGWYGGGGGEQSDSAKIYAGYSGGGSGFVNTSANSSYRPSGYTGLQLDSGSTYDGDQTFVSPSGGNETGHPGNGYARITRL